MESYWDTETRKVAALLDSPAMRPSLERLVNDWNDLELLGIDLADQIEKLVRTAFQIDRDKVEWGQLADHYALEIANVGEEELSRRREAAAAL